MRQGNTSKLLIVLLLLALTTLACGGVTVVVTPNPSLAQPTATFTSIPTLVPSPTSTPPIMAPAPTSAPPASFTPYYLNTAVENGNLRTEPGTVFPVSRVMARGTRLQVNGHAPGGEWIYVRTDTLIYGWVLGWLLEGWPNLPPTPMVTPQNVQLVTGTVVDLSGVPISGIGFAVTQSTGARAPRTDATTDGSGRFYAYLPPNASGQWTVSYVSVSCTSNSMDGDCNCIGFCGKAEPQSVFISLPFGGGAGPDLSFTWK